MSIFPSLLAAENDIPLQQSGAGASVSGDHARDWETARDRIAALRLEVARHDDLYYRKASPEISDAQYDQLKRDLEYLESLYPDLAESIPDIAAIGDDRTGAFPDHRHLAPMLSLDKAYSEDELRAFYDRVTQRVGSEEVLFVVEPKIDGIAVSVTFEKGKMVRAVTRGNGRRGEDITSNALTVARMPRRLSGQRASDEDDPVPDLVELRGEIFVSLEDFRRLNRQRTAAGAEPFAHPRNLAAGTVKLADLVEARSRSLSIAFFGYGAYQPLGDVPDSLRRFYDQARTWGLPVLEESRSAKGWAELVAGVRNMQAQRNQYPYPTDGIVVKVDARDLQTLLGESASAPRWALACKFISPSTETILRDITIQVGRTGILTPVAELEPVMLDGSQISRATLHNAATITEKDIRIGDSVILEKAGEIIPAIVGVNFSKRGGNSVPFEFPTACPSCGAALSADGAQTSIIRCLNAQCPARRLRRLEHFASSQAVGIDGMGEATIAALVAKGCLNSIPDFYRLGENDILGLDNVSDVSAESLLKAIENSKRAELWRFIYGLGIPSVGAKRARDVAAAFGSLEAFTRLDASELREKGATASAAGLRPATVEALVAHFAAERNRKIIAQLIELGVRPVSGMAHSIASDRPVAGMEFVLTGRLPNLSRTEATTLIERAGGSVRSRVRAETDFVVAGSDPGAKLAQGKAMEVSIIDEAGLLRLLSP